jgi:hypothetical protein
VRRLPCGPMQYDQQTVTFEAMLFGFDEATKRWREAIKTRNTIRSYAAMFEALTWAASLDERVADDWAPDGQTLGFRWRGQVPQAEIIAGVRFARNRSHHQWANTVDLLTTKADGFPLKYQEWRWRAADNLPPGDPKHPDPYGDRVYREQLEGEHIGRALDVLSDVFSMLQRL